MKSKNIVLLLVLVLVNVGLLAQGVYIPKSNDIQEKDGKQYYVHTVQKGQTVYSIAKAYDVTIDEIYFENPDAKFGLQIGQQLWIPTVNKETEVNNEVSTASFDFFYHIADAGESFLHIAQLYNIPERYIRLANPKLSEPLKEGEYVKVPVEASFPVLDGKQKAPHKAPQTSYIPAPDVSMGQTNVKTPQKTIKHQQPEEVSFNPNIKVMENYRHVVVRGETLESIAKKYQISVADLKSVNPGLQTVVQGDRLRIPAYSVIPGVRKAEDKRPHVVDSSPQKNKKPSKQTDKSKTFFKYSVQSGENLYTIARKFGVAPETLLKLNPSVNSSNVRTGQVLVIPKLQKKPHYIYYQVPRKTRLKKIARLFKINYSELKRANPTLKNRVYAGQTVKIPGGSHAVLIAAEPEIKEPADNENVFEEQANQRCTPKPHHGKEVKVALMVPLYLEEMDSVNSVEFLKTFQPGFKPFTFVNFLEGAFLAVDSLRQMGYTIELNIYDVDNKITKTAKTLQQPELRDMDLIIGPFYSKSFNQVALFAENFNIPVVNPFTFRNSILGKYKNIIKVKPGAASQIPLLTELIRRLYARDKIFIITQTPYKDADLVNYLKTGIEEKIPAKINLPNIDINNLAIEVANRLDEEGEPVSPYFSVEGLPIDPALVDAYLYDSTTFDNKPILINYMVDSLHPFLDNASVIRNNLVIIYGNNKPFIMDVVNKLNRVRDTFNINIVGAPLWEQIKNMDYALLNNLNLTYFTSNYIDYNLASVNRFNADFESSFSTEPGRFGYSGFDITLFFVKARADYGKRFLKCLPSVNSLTFENGFQFDKVEDTDSNYENVMWNLLQIKNYKTIRLPESNLIPVEEQEK